jgi:hypothetical protein
MLKEELRRMLLEFIHEMQQENWFGKEREIVSRFAFSKLIKNIGCCEAFYDAAQIGIEMRVKQVAQAEQGKSVKKEVCKDLMIWQFPNQTRWSDPDYPNCIIEWKHKNKAPSEYDITWLKAYTKTYPDCFGIALNVENENAVYKISGVLISNGEIEDAHWLE